MTCTTEGCPRQAVARGLCHRHYTAARTRGDFTPRPYGTNGPRHRAPAAGRLEALCWCEHRIIHVPATDIRAGRTGTCGRPDCHPPKGTP